jgi:hypothetical protein
MAIVNDRSSFRPRWESVMLYGLMIIIMLLSLGQASRRIAGMGSSLIFPHHAQDRAEVSVLKTIDANNDDVDPTPMPAGPLIVK